MLQHLITYPEDIIWRLDILLYTVSALLSFSLFQVGSCKCRLKAPLPQQQNFWKTRVQVAAQSSLQRAAVLQIPARVQLQKRGESKGES